MLSNLNDDSLGRLWLGWKLERLVVRKSYGKGKGCRGSQRKVKPRFETIDVYETIKRHNVTKLETLVHMKVDEFELLIDGLKNGFIHQQLRKNYFIFNCGLIF